MDPLEEVRTLQAGCRRVLEAIRQQQIDGATARAAVDALTLYLELIQLEEQYERKAQHRSKIDHD